MCHTRAARDYESARSECLACLGEVLCAPPMAGCAERGWQLETSLQHCLTLYHPELRMRMDVQVSG